MSDAGAANRPRRWDKPFGAEVMTDADIDRVLALPVFAEIDPEDFPSDLPLRGIVANDGRIRRFSRGDIIIRRGDYGSSVFVILDGGVRGFASEEAEQMVAPRDARPQKTWFQALAQLWQNSKIPEFRETVRYQQSDGASRKENAPSTGLVLDRGITVSKNYVGRDRRSNRTIYSAGGAIQVATYSGPDRRKSSELGETVVTRLNDADEFINSYPTFPIEAPDMFGELAALARSPRGATIFAATDEVEVVELRWQGLRDIRQWSDSFGKWIGDVYRERGLIAHLLASPIFQHLDETTLKIIADQTLFETHGAFEWNQTFQRLRSQTDTIDEMISHEPLIAEEGHYLDGLLLVRSGFARVSVKVDHGEKTVGYLANNDVFGLEELAESTAGGKDPKLRRSLRAIGYVDILRVPTRLVEEHVLPSLPPELMPKVLAGTEQSPPAEKVAVGSTVSPMAHGDEIEQPLIDFLVDNRIINGTAAMLINTDRCVNCDDCVRACASTHGGNPRFVRHGYAHQNVMVANACMHCVDPVCLIGCPTGAIHRSAQSGNVIIDDATCIGCATCANSCPYSNIRMVETRDVTGSFIVDDELMPIAKATKCDLCAGQIGGPACERACPHGALIRTDARDFEGLTTWLER